MDSTFITETPPLRASWETRVPVLNIQTGTLLLHRSPRWHQAVFQALLREVRRTWRGWPSSRPTRPVGLGPWPIRFLPRAASRLNPVESLGRYAKGPLLANVPTRTVSASVDPVWRGLLELSPRDRLRRAGVLSPRFWLRKVISSPQLSGPT